MSKQNELSLDKEKDEAFLEALFETILENKNLEDIKMLINVLPDVNVASENGTTFLMWASKAGMPEIVQELMNKGAKVNAKDKNGKDAPLLAYENGHLHLAHTLLEDKIKPVFTPNNNTNIKPNPNLFKQLFPQPDQQPAPSLAISFDRKDIYHPYSTHSKWQERDKKVEESKKKHSIIDEINIDTPENILANALLILACKKGHKGLIKQLLMRDDIDVNTFYGKESSYVKHMDNALYYACKKDDAETVKWLLDKGADVNLPALNPPIITACFANNINTVKLLIDYKANINDLDYSGNIPLTIAGEKGNIELVQLLLENGANIDSLKGSNSGILSHIIKKGDDENNIELVKLLSAWGIITALIKNYNNSIDRIPTWKMFASLETDLDNTNYFKSLTNQYNFRI